MSLDEIEELARAVGKASHNAKAAAAELLAERVLLLLPVVMAAEAWSESFGELSKRLPPHVHDLRRAVDAMSEALKEST